MTENQNITLSDARKAFRVLGYRILTKRYADFIAGRILAADGIEVNAGNVHRRDFLDDHQAAFALRRELKGRIFDGGLRVVL